MTTQELKDRYAHLYAEMAKSKDTSKMRLFGTAFTQMFDKVAASHPDIASATIDFLQAIEYHNYVTVTEATDVAHHFINDDIAITGGAEPSADAHWSMEALKGFLTQKGLPLEDKPYYNWPSLWLTVNMEYSDYADAISEMLGTKDNEKIAVACYKMAVKKLKDKDRPHFIREYFKLDE